MQREDGYFPMGLGRWVNPHTKEARGFPGITTKAKLIEICGNFLDDVNGFIQVPPYLPEKRWEDDFFGPWDDEWSEEKHERT